MDRGLDIIISKGSPQPKSHEHGLEVGVQNRRDTLGNLLTLLPYGK
jgi:hypothetical protein